MKSKPAAAQYLLRFDDLCPTMDRDRWEQFASLIKRYRLRPILSVVPDNEDPELAVDVADESFWEQMLALESAGATIGLHGYRHVCAANGPSLIPVRKQTEFAGVPRELQREWIANGLAMLRSQGLHPRIWVAPRHGTDLITLRVLREEGIAVLSDGLSTRPYREHAMIWIPQQIWAPVEKKSGLWTICIHSNTATDQDVESLEVFLERFVDQFTSVEWALAQWPIGDRTYSDRLFHGWTTLRRRLSATRQQFGLSR